MVWLRVPFELHRVNLFQSLEKGLDRAVHAVHHGATRREDDGERETRFLDQLDVFDHRTPGRPFVIADPLLVKLSDILERYLLSWQVLGELNQTIHVP